MFTVQVPKMQSIKNICKVFEVGRYTIDKAIQNKELKAYKPNGRDFLLDTEEVLAWIKTKKV